MPSDVRIAYGQEQIEAGHRKIAEGNRMLQEADRRLDEGYRRPGTGPKTSTLVGWGIAVFFWSIFMGVTAISIGFGAMFPPMNLVAGPFVCPNGQMTYEESTSNPLPGTTYTQIYWYCVDARSGTNSELDIFPMSLYSGVLYGLLLFAVVLLIWYISSRRKTAQPAADAQPARGPDEQQDGTTHANLERMKELKELHENRMISDEEYAQKREEILKEL